MIVAGPNALFGNRCACYPRMFARLRPECNTFCGISPTNFGMRTASSSRCDNSDQVTACVKERSTAVAGLYGRADLQIARIVGNAGESVSRCQLKPWLPWRERAKGDSGP